MSDPLKEGNHFSTSADGVNGLFENMRNNTQVRTKYICLGPAWNSC